MKQHFGNHLGLCINNDDPQKRGRVQVFIPHILPLLYDDWNNVGEDIKFLCVGDNLPQSIPSNIVEKLKKILPWAEAASPVFGSSAPGGSVGNNYYQSPVANPTVPAPANVNENNVTANLPDTFTPVGVDTSNSYKGPVTEKGTHSAVKPEYIVLHDVSGPTDKNGNPQLDASGKRVHTPTVEDGLGHYNYVVGGGKVYESIPAGLNAPHAVAYNSKSIGISRVGYEVDPITPQDANALASLVSQLAKQYNIPRDHIITHPETGSAGTLSGKDPREAIWKDQVLSIVDNTDNGGVAPETTAPAPGSTPVKSGPETTSTSGQASTYNTFASPNPVTGSGALYGTAALPFVEQSGSTGTGGIAQITTHQERDEHGNLVDVMDEASFKQAAALRLANSPLLTTPVSDAAKYGVNPTDPYSWANFFWNISDYENGHRLQQYLPNDGNREGNPLGGSYGPFSLSVQDIATYGKKAIPSANDQAGIEAKRQELQNNPIFAFDIAASQAEIQIGRTGAIDGLYAENGGSYALNTLRKAAGGTAPATGIGVNNPLANRDGSTKDSFNAAGISSMSHLTDNHGATATLNINNMAKGLFSYPAAGSVLWVFFREGNPLFPVYFAASFGENEWKSAYRQGSDAPGYAPAGKAPSIGGNMNLGVGGIRWEDTTVPDNARQTQKSFMIYGHDGSNIFFNNGYHQIFSKFNRRDQVDGDRFQSTLGSKEEWVQTENNSVTMGNHYVTTGNFSPEVINAMERINQHIKDIMKPQATSDFAAPTIPDYKNSPNPYIRRAAARLTLEVPSNIVPNIPAAEQLSAIFVRDPYEQTFTSTNVQSITSVPIMPPTH